MSGAGRPEVGCTRAVPAAAARAREREREREGGREREREGEGGREREREGGRAGREQRSERCVATQPAARVLPAGRKQRQTFARAGAGARGGRAAGGRAVRHAGTTARLRGRRRAACPVHGAHGPGAPTPPGAQIADAWRRRASEQAGCWRMAGLLHVARCVARPRLVCCVCCGPCPSWLRTEPEEEEEEEEEEERKKKKW